MEFVVDEVSKNVAKQLNSSHPAPSSVAQPDWNIITESIVNGSCMMEVLVKHQVMSSAPSPMKKRYFEDVMAANALEADTKCQKAELEQQLLLIAKEKQKLS